MYSSTKQIIPSIKICSIFSIGLITGCASITGSKNQPVSITTACDGAVVNGAACTLTNDKGQWFLQTPGSVTIQKAYGDLSVVCKKGEATGSSVFQSKSNGGVWGNLLIGGPIGYVVDANSGAGFDYPPTMSIALNGVCPK